MGIRLILHWLGIAALLLIVLGFSIGTVRPMPDYAQIIVDDSSRTYFAPPYFTDNGLHPPPNARTTVAGEMTGKGYNPDRGCRDKGYFIQHTGPLIASIGRKIGLLNSRSRWNEDGTWNW